MAQIIRTYIVRVDGDEGSHGVTGRDLVWDRVAVFRGTGRDYIVWMTYRVERSLGSLKVMVD